MLFCFTSGYFLTASILNKTGVNTNNLYFSSDSASWYLRMAGEEGWDLVTRAVHPLAPLLFRPAITFLSFFTNGDRFHAALILLAMAGGGCVFLTWKIIKLLTANRSYAVLGASLLGLSASHMIFASVLETYIFSAFCLLCFIWLILSHKTNFVLIATGVVTLGITLTNVTQQALTFLFIRQSIKRTALVFSLVLFFGICLNIVTKSIYPTTEYFFIPQNLAGEQRFSREVNLKRIELVAKNLLIYNMVAPQPYFSTRKEMPRFNFLSDSIENYVWFGWAAVVPWGSMLGCSLIYLLGRKYPLKDSKILLSMLACLLFNFLLHIGYGIEPFLYSTGWTYALVLIVAIVFQDAARRDIFMIAGLVLVILLMLNNLWLLYLIIGRSGAYLA